MSLGAGSPPVVVERRLRWGADLPEGRWAARAEPKQWTPNTQATAMAGRDGFFGDKRSAPFLKVLLRGRQPKHTPFQRKHKQILREKQQTDATRVIPETPSPSFSPRGERGVRTNSKKDGAAIGRRTPLGIFLSSCSWPIALNFGGLGTEPPASSPHNAESQIPASIHYSAPPKSAPFGSPDRIGSPEPQLGFRISLPDERR